MQDTLCMGNVIGSKSVQDTLCMGNVIGSKSVYI